jgi:hypothetical protein
VAAANRNDPGFDPAGIDRPRRGAFIGKWEYHAHVVEQGDEDPERVAWRMEEFARARGIF